MLQIEKFQKKMVNVDFMYRQSCSPSQLVLASLTEKIFIERNTGNKCNRLFYPHVFQDGLFNLTLSI